MKVSSVTGERVKQIGTQNLRFPTSRTYLRRKDKHETKIRTLTNAAVLLAMTGQTSLTYGSFVPRSAGDDIATPPNLSFKFVKES